MRVTYKTSDGRLQVEVEGQTQKEIFKGIANFNEIFEAEPCGLCANEDTRFGVRTIDGNDYYEKRCTKCHATLSYGQMITGGGLFPKRKKEDGTWDTDHRGWYRWQAKSS